MKKGMGIVGILLACVVISWVMLGSGAGQETTASPADAAAASVAIVDDYTATSTEDRPWYYTRIGTDRGPTGEGEFNVEIGGGTAAVTVTDGWAGVWTSLLHGGMTEDALPPTQLLGPYVKDEYQPRITGIEIDLVDGTGTFKIDLIGADGQALESHEFTLEGGERTVEMAVTTDAAIKALNWLVQGSGSAAVDQVRLVLEQPDYASMAERAFLYSYGHLSQCYDEPSGLVRDRARWPAEAFANVPATGMYALATVVASDLGYVDASVAEDIVESTKSAILSLPRSHGLLPHFVTEGDITEGTHWSSLDSAIALIAEMLACQALGVDTSDLESTMRGIDWVDLTDSGSHSIGLGYDDTGEKLEGTWGTFGSEAFLVALAYCASTGSSDIMLDANPDPPTSEGSGFSDELAALFLPMDSTDRWGNDWQAYRAEAAQNQIGFF